MRCSICITAVMAIVLGFAAGATAQETNTTAQNEATVKALNNAMTPGEGQKRLEFMAGTFDVKVRVWVDPSKPPIESTAAGVGTWVLGHRYIQVMLSGFIKDEPWNVIGYAGFDNIQKKYVACYMDSGSTGMEWFKGVMDPDGKSAKLTATTYDEITGKPTKVEMRLSIAPNGEHLTELWEANPSGKMIKIMELQYTRKK